MKKKFNRLIIFISVIVVLVFSFAYLINLRYSADSSPVYSGYTVTIFDEPADGVSVKLICSSKNLPGVKEYSGMSNVNGFFSIPIENPSVCLYRVFAGGGDYNYSQHGSVDLKNLKNNPIDPETNRITVDKEVDLMESSYPDLSGIYPGGYNNTYPLSSYDAYLARNKVGIEKFLEPMSPASAKIKIPVSNLNDLMCVDGPGVIAKDDKTSFNYSVNVNAINSNWENFDDITTSGWVGLKEYTISCDGSGDNEIENIEIDLDLSNLSKNNRYYAWVNGFKITAHVSSNNPHYALNSLPYYTIPRSEDNGGALPTTVEYGGLEKLKESGHGFQGEVVGPIAGNPLITSDFGDRSKPGHSPWCHRGIDLGVGRGTEIRAVNAGVVITAEYSSAYGYYIIIEHCNEMYTWYGHLIKGSFRVGVGDEVKAGDVIGLVDNTGYSSGNHLHFSVAYKSPSNYLDPLIYFSGSTGSIVVGEWPGYPRRNKTKDPETRKDLLSKDRCVINGGWIYE